MAQGSTLTATGRTKTSAEARRWANKTSERIRKALGTTDVKARIWTYRGGSEALVMECHDGAGGTAVVTFHTVWVMKPALDEERLVPDMAEALHLAGLVLADLDVRPTIGTQTPRPSRRNRT